MAKFGLGKGLEALITEAPSQDPTSSEPVANGITIVEISNILPNKDQPRKSFDDASIAELSASIKRHGLIQPLVVEKDSGGQYRIIAGERRWRAAKLAGLTALPVIVKEYGRDKRLEVALVENVQREDLNPIDEAEAYRQLMEATGLTQEDVAERVGKSRPSIANALRLLSLPPEAMDALRGGVISAGLARTILSLVNPADRQLLLRRALDEGISVREAEAWAARLNKGDKTLEAKPVKKSKPEKLMPEIKAIEQSLIEKLGTKVEIKGSAVRGSIVIEYFSMDDLDRLYEIISKNN